MLEKLDEIPWARLHHAYGTADDVPGLLRNLAGSDQSQREALDELHGNIWHQGTVYEASAYAVPFLVELSADSRCGHRDEVLGLIGALADGRSYLDVHGAPDQFVGKLLRQKSDFEERLNQELDYVGQTRAAVLKDRQVFLRLLSDSTPMVRAAAAYVLSRFPELRREFGPSLVCAAWSEGEKLPRAAMLWCVGALGEDTPEALDLLDTVLRENSDPRQMFAAAIALYQITEIRGFYAEPIYRCMAAATWFTAGFLSGAPWNALLSAEWVEWLSAVEPDAPTATAMLLRLLNEPSVETYTMTTIVHDLLQMNFTDGDWRRADRGWTDIQRSVARQLVATDAAWSDTKRLWFLVRDGAKRISKLTDSDIRLARREMANVLASHGG